MLFKDAYLWKILVEPVASSTLLINTVPLSDTASNSCCQIIPSSSCWCRTRSTALTLSWQWADKSTVSEMYLYDTLRCLSATVLLFKDKSNEHQRKPLVIWTVLEEKDSMDGSLSFWRNTVNIWSHQILLWLWPMGEQRLFFTKDFLLKKWVTVDTCSSSSEAGSCRIWNPLWFNVVIYCWISGNVYPQCKM